MMISLKTGISPREVQPHRPRLINEISRTHRTCHFLICNAKAFGDSLVIAEGVTGGAELGLFRVVRDSAPRFGVRCMFSGHKLGTCLTCIMR